MRNDRYESLDGIKGFALIGIIWYHLSQRSLPGGFIGVDVFFTVSGFLLALSVLREIDRTGRLRLGNFYLRRLSRLWPAMAFMIAGSVSLGLFVNHDILVGVPGKSVSALTFTSNWGGRSSPETAISRRRRRNCCGTYGSWRCWAKRRWCCRF